MSRLEPAQKFELFMRGAAKYKVLANYVVSGKVGGEIGWGGSVHSGM